MWIDLAKAKRRLEEKNDLQHRMLATHLLLMLYTRSRTSDLAHVHEVLHDVSSKDAVSGGPGFIQISTRHHKSARSAEKKNLQLSILASSSGVTEDDWLATWLRLRRQAGLKVAGQFDCAMQPAADLNNQGCWLQRPLTCSETTMLLRLSLGEQRQGLDVSFTEGDLPILGSQGRVTKGAEKVAGPKCLSAPRTLTVSTPGI